MTETTGGGEVTKKLMCIVMRSGVEIWVEDEYIGRLKKILTAGSGDAKFLEIGEEVINSKDIIGIFEAKTMEEVTRRKNGQWKDEKGMWHDKGERICPRCKTVLPPGMTCGRCRY